MHRLSARIVSAFLMVLGLTLGMSQPARALDAAGLPSAIENAATTADHEAIAAFYDSEAKTARTQAERHSAMGKAYAKGPKPTGGRKGSRWAVYRTMSPHCEDLVKGYKKAAHQYDEMAAAHRKEASEIK